MQIHWNFDVVRLSVTRFSYIVLLQHSDAHGDYFKNISCGYLGQLVPKHWKLGKLLGTGAFGQVFLCHDTENGREMAVKQIETGITNTATQKVGFLFYPKKLL